jgi:hypothetical protein
MSKKVEIRTLAKVLDTRLLKQRLEALDPSHIEGSSHPKTSAKSVN